MVEKACLDLSNISQAAFELIKHIDHFKVFMQLSEYSEESQSNVRSLALAIMSQIFFIDGTGISLFNQMK